MQLSILSSGKDGLHLEWSAVPAAASYVLYWSDRETDPANYYTGGISEAQEMAAKEN